MSIKEIREREAKATPGPWVWEYVEGEQWLSGPADEAGLSTSVCTGYRQSDCGFSVDEDCSCGCENPADAKFIAHARKDIMHWC